MMEKSNSLDFAGTAPGSGRSSISDESSVFSPTAAIDKRCGYFRCKPKCLQKCAKPRFLLVCMCLFGLIEACIQWGLVNISISAWERRYQLRSTQSAWIVTSADISNGVLAPIFGYLGTFYHKGRILSIGAIFMFIGSFLFLVPHFAADVYEFGGLYGQDTCDLYGNSTECAEGADSAPDQDGWLVVFCIAQLLFGYVSCSIWTVGITYVDDNVTMENSVLFIGILNAFGAVGAVIGFLAGGLFLEIYVDVGRVDMDNINIDSSDPRWVGAWWIGFAGVTVLSIPVMFLMPCFPEELPAVAKLRARKKSEAYKGFGEEEMQRENFGRTCADLGFSLRVIFGNPVFVLITIAGIVEVGGVAAFASFLPKIIQFQFGQTSSMAAIIAGAVLVPGAAIGQLLGGIIPKAMNLKFRGVMWMLIIAQFVCVLCSAGFLASCPTPQLAGYNVEWPLNSTVFEDPFTQLCNVDCGCSTAEFAPICSTEGISYFSPCYAGCLSETEVDGKQMFGNCSCIPNINATMYQAEGGICSTSCFKFWIFMPLLLVLIIATFIENTGGYAVVMRVVPEKQRSFAFGVQTPIIRYLGNVPIPILFGLIFDLACDVWQDNCGSQGACWIYDTSYLSVGMFVACLIIKGVSGLCFLIGVLIYKPPADDEKTDSISDTKSTGKMKISNTADDRLYGEDKKAYGFDNSGFYSRDQIEDSSYL